MRLSPNELAFITKNLWTGEDWPVAIAVALAESNGETDALGWVSGSDNYDHGIFQISNKWQQLRGDGSPGPLAIIGGHWRNPYRNAEAARMVFDERVKIDGDGWNAWSVYKTGSYLKFMPAALVAIKCPIVPKFFPNPVI